jgi:hypothetical protein
VRKLRPTAGCDTKEEEHTHLHGMDSVSLCEVIRPKLWVCVCFEDYCLLVCDAVRFCRYVSTCEKNLACLTLTSGVHKSHAPGRRDD